VPEEMSELDNVMDIYSLVAAHIRPEARPTPMTTEAEARYYANQIVLPHLSRRLLGSIAALAGVILILGASLPWVGVHAVGSMSH